MNSSINNIANQKVEKLDYTGVILQLASSGPTLIYNHAIATFFVNPQRIYEIHRMNIVIDNFIDLDTDTYAFPRFEQFALGLSISADLGYVKGIIPTPVKIISLFSDMRYHTSDGISHQYVFKEPYIFNTANQLLKNLFLTFTNDQSVFVTLDSFTMPPASEININGLVSLEGISFDTTTAEKLTRKAIS